jgi:hypothetical protein
MSGSYRKINYDIRPAKSIERKMLCEALRKLIIFSDLTKYRYVGFGSTFFTDFLLIHKSLGLNHLISIEKEEDDKKRFEFNCPYRCVQLRFGDANDVLPTINWGKKIILWLDYDEPLKESMLTDIGTFISQAQTGSIILLTVEVNPDKLPDKKGEKSRYKQLTERIDKVKIPIDVEEKDLDNKNYPRVCYNIVNNEIDEVLSKRNGGLENKLIYKQLFNFYYQDSSPMLSIGGILYTENDDNKIEKCHFDKLDFIRLEKDKYDPYKIDVPNLTFREMRCLDKMMPFNNISELKNKEKPAFLTKKMIEDYSKIYRYVPNFVEAEIH